MSKANNMELLLRQIEKNISEYSSRAEPLQFHWYKYLTPPRQEQLYRKVVCDLPAVIERAKAEFEDGNRSKAISSILFVLEDMFEPIMGYDISWAINTLKERNRPRHNKEWERESIGYTVAVLILFGSSANQAIDSVSDWLLMSRTKVRDAFYFVRDKGELVNREAITDTFQLGRYLWRFTDELEDLRAFPQEYSKAYRAFVKASIFLYEAEHNISRNNENFFDAKERWSVYKRIFGMSTTSLLGIIAEKKFKMILKNTSCNGIKDIEQAYNCND